MKIKLKPKPKYIQTKNGTIYTFNEWYVFSISDVPGSEWLGAQVTDKKGRSFGIHIDNIKAEIYENRIKNTV